MILLYADELKCSVERWRNLGIPALYEDFGEQTYRHCKTVMSNSGSLRAKSDSDGCLTSCSVMAN